MISIIICTRKREGKSQVEDNINATIGNIAHEIIWIDNYDNQYSIFQAYQVGTRKAQYEYLCFMHDDIIFHTENWGEICITHMTSHPRTGLLGVIGGSYVSKFSEGWWSMQESRKGRVLQKMNIRGKVMTKEVIFGQDETNHEVVSIDGLWMFTKAELFDKSVEWDTNHYNGFHFYDLDLCMQIVKAGFSIEVVPIVIEHLSGGSKNQSFWDNYLLFHKKWNDFLPVSVPGISKEAITDYETTLMETICANNKTILEQKAIIWDLRTQLSKMGYYRIQKTLKAIKAILKR